MDSSSGHSGRQRAQAACIYCRKRKMKCNNEKPRCTNCMVYEQECLYTQSSRKKKAAESAKASSDDRVSRLEEENRGLRKRLATTNSALANHLPHQDPTQQTQHDQPCTTFSSSASSLAPSPHSLADEWQTGGSGRAQATRPESTYVGLTSASVLQDTPRDRVVGFSTDQKLKDAGLSSQRLEAEAAKQRRREASNYYSRSLDFDGVEPDLAMHLLTSHWHRLHHSYLITYRPAFMRDMACEGPYFSKLLLNAIYFGASRFTSRIEVRSDPEDVRTAGWAFRQRVKELLVPEIETSKITTIQALLVMTRSLFALGEEKSVAWVYAGIAFRMMVDLGMHRDGAPSANTANFSAEDWEIRRRVFWAAFIMDKIQSLYQGRPVELQWVNCDVPLAFLDQYEERELWQPFEFSGSGHYSQTPAYSISTFLNMCKLCIIMNDILNKVYAIRSQGHGTDSLAEHIVPLHARLEQWYSNLETHLKFDATDTAHVVPPPAVLSLISMYYVLLVQLHHPLIARGYSYPVSPPDAQDSFTICANAAREIVLILTAYDKTFSIRKAPYLIGYAIYVSATIHIRIVARRGHASDSLANLKTCLDLLTLNQETNPGVCNARASLKHLMDRLGVVDPEYQSLITTPPSSAPLSLSPYSATGSQQGFPNIRHSPRDALASTRVPYVESRRGTTNTGSSFEFDNFLQSFAESQLSMSHSSDSLNYGDAAPQYQPEAGLSSGLDILSANSFETTLLDPAAVTYTRGSAGTAEQPRLYGGYGGCLSYGGSPEGYGI